MARQAAGRHGRCLLGDPPARLAGSVPGRRRSRRWWPGATRLDVRYREVEERFAGQDVPVPPEWGGYRVQPATFEFWQGRRSRLHDRLLYARTASGWEITRLAP
ncbi:pyridoxine 5'-phosphate oxidase C-terminal domain-containing protein [Nocardioides convexus]|uniref:pyridoxine 5'-phosphate oxidase C-terminal domain-containing protein n=1 Tax=Nocardioides convexus TaxID=2712224 RepID=UPI002418B7B4|nr:pyridoxine 5'-phosphate oxidase C-terminal domain-containing protein [Nocardioides convexus]